MHPSGSVARIADVLLFSMKCCVSIAARGLPFCSCRLADQLSVSIRATDQKSGALLFRLPGCRSNSLALRYNATGGAV